MQPPTDPSTIVHQDHHITIQNRAIAEQERRAAEAPPPKDPLAGVVITERDASETDAMPEPQPPRSELPPPDAPYTHPEAVATALPLSVPAVVIGLAPDGPQSPLGAPDAPTQPSGEVQLLVTDVDLLLRAVATLTERELGVRESLVPADARLILEEYLELEEEDESDEPTDEGT